MRPARFFLVSGCTAALAALYPLPSLAQADGCQAAAPVKAKKKGFGGLLSAARKSGLQGALQGALRGDGNLRAEVAGAAINAAASAADGAADCDSGEGATADEGSAGLLPSATKKKAVSAGAALYPSQMAVPASVKEQIAAFDAFGKVRCSDCEGGYAYESWAKQAYVGELRGEYNGWAKKLGSLALDAKLPWTSGSSRGVITVASEEPVQGFRCRQLRYVLTRGKASAERPGLVCWGKINQYAGSESWVEVY